MLKINELYGSNQYFYDKVKSSVSFRIRCCIPGIIQSYDPIKNIAEIQPSIRERIILGDGTLQFVDLPLLINVPILFPSSSKYSISFPLEKNDEVLVLFSDLSIDNFWEKGSVQNPIENRRHDLSDGLAIPCNISLTKGFENEGYLTVKGDGCKVQFKNNDISFITQNSLISIDQIYNYILNNLIIVEQPVDYVGELGDRASFTVIAGGIDISYQWYVSTNDGSTWSTSGSSGNKTKTLQGITITEIRYTYLYRCMITDYKGNQIYTNAVRIVKPS